MNDYTPTTEEVRLDYAPAKTFPADAEEQFDRWLFQMQEDAWDRGYQAGVVDFAIEGNTNPYRQGQEQ